MQLSDEFIAKGKQQYHNKLTNLKRIVGDPVITPFVLAMKLAGYRELLIQHCSILRCCPNCTNNYSQQYEKNRKFVWACPHCNKILEI